MKLFREKFLILLMFGVLIFGVGISAWALKNISNQSTQSLNHELDYEASIMIDNKQLIEITQEDIILDLFTPAFKSESEITRENSDFLYSLYPIETVRVPDLERESPIVGKTEKNGLTSVSIKSGTIGTLTIPALERILPIVEGTEEEDLKLGVGHFSGSVLPGENDNSVLSGHRGTVFAKLDELEIGDQLITTTSSGTFIYEINELRIVDKDDKTVIVPTDHAVLTLTTCYPFHFIGNAPKRYIVSADLIDTVIESINKY